NLGRVESHPANFRLGGLVIAGVYGIGKEELRLSLGTVDFDRNNDSRSDQDPVRRLLGHDHRSLFDPVSPPHLCRKNDRPPPPNLVGLTHKGGRISDIQIFRQSLQGGLTSWGQVYVIHYESTARRAASRRRWRAGPGR